MELNDRIFELSVQGNLHGQLIKVIRNGEEILAGDTCVQAKHIIKNLEFETGKMRGCSILEHYSVKDGFLEDKEGNQIHFSSDRFPEIKINRIKTPFLLNNEVVVDLAYVKDVSTLLNMQTPEDTIKGLSDEEIKALQDEREKAKTELEAENARIKAEEDEKAAEEARVAEEEAKTKAEQEAAAEVTRIAEEEARKSEEARIQAEKDAEEARVQAEKSAEEARIAAEEARIAAEEERKRIEEEEKSYVLSTKEFEKLARRNKKAGMTEYTSKEGYHFFYGPDLPKGEEPCILKKRSNGTYEELKGGIVDENAEEVEFEFELIDGTEFTVILNLGTEDMTIEKN